MFLLHEITGDDHWMDWLHANMRGLTSTGMPEERTAGLWNNFGQCCFLLRLETDDSDGAAKIALADVPFSV